MQIEKLDIDRYYVGDYLIELTAYDGNAWCSCSDFQYRHQPKLQKQEDSGIKIEVSRCKHITALMAHLNPTIECAQNEKEAAKVLAQETGSHSDSEENSNRDSVMVFPDDSYYYKQIPTTFHTIKTSPFTHPFEAKGTHQR